MMSRNCGVFVVCLATLGCSGEAMEDARPDDAPQTASISEALTAAGLDGLCFHLARNEATPLYATLTDTPDSDVRARAPAALPDPPQVWCFEAVADKTSTYRIREADGFSYLDAHDKSAYDHRVVVRPYQNNLTQEWIVSGGPSWFRLQQASSGRYLDSYPNSNDRQFVTRSFQDDETQDFGLFVPSPTSCTLHSAYWAATECSMSVSCQYYPGAVQVACQQSQDEWNCSCWYLDVELLMMLSSEDACSDAMDLCLPD